jgi:tRNA(Met) cytidine acetyltransferase
MFDMNIFKTWLEAKKSGTHHRQILMIDLPLLHLLPVITYVSEQSENTALMSSDLTINTVTSIPIDRYQEQLGQQVSSLIFDARFGFNLNALYAGAGMIKQAGLLVVLLPRNDTVNQQKGGLRFSYGHQPSTSLFAELFRTQGLHYNAAFINDSSVSLPSSAISHLPLPLPLQKKPELTKGKKSTGFALSQKQSEIHNDVLSNIFGTNENGSSVSVILGPRGRGKSTLLAYIANSMLANPMQKPIIITALHKKQLLAFYDASSVFTGLSNYKFSFADKQHDSDTKNQTASNLRSPMFYSVDEITSRAPRNAVVLIDEIASIAPELVKQITTYFSHCVVTGTSSGYEGSGQGFVQRLLPYLENTHNTNVYTLNQPFRWLTDDPLEALLNCIIAETPCADSSTLLCERTFNAQNDVSYALVEKRDLLADIKLYQQIFNLLSEAHYQTTPNDIVRTLDSSDCKLVVAYEVSLQQKTQLPLLRTSLTNACIVGVAVLFEEGGKILEPLSEDICIGTRRVQGHLSPQSLAMYLFVPEVCQLNYLRINRIAVSRYCQGQGIGTKLLNFCENYAEQKKVNYITVSFGYTPSLFSFWEDNNYTLAKIGHRIDTASGTASVLLLKPITRSEHIDFCYLKLRLILEKEYLIANNARLSDIYGGLFTAIGSLTPSEIEPCESKVYAALRRFVKRELSLEKALPLFYWFTLLNNHAAILNDTKAIFDAIGNYNTKGTHKHIKDELAEYIRRAIEKIIAT